MIMIRQKIALVAAVLFIIGSGLIVMNGRPIVKMNNANSTNVNSTNANANSNSSSEAGTYSMDEVTAHSTVESCWATINGSVYDLTTWISRHPGGPDRIIGLCGTDATAKFAKKHGTAPKPQATLLLLKIGTLR